MLRSLRSHSFRLNLLFFDFRSHSFRRLSHCFRRLCSGCRRSGLCGRPAHHSLGSPRRQGSPALTKPDDADLQQDPGLARPAGRVSCLRQFHDPPVDVFQLHDRTLFPDPVDVLDRQIDDRTGIPYEFRHHQIPVITDPVADQLPYILAVRQHLCQEFYGLRGPAFGYQVGQPGEDFLAGCSQKIQHLRRVHRLVSAGDALIQNAESVPDGTVRVGRDDPQRSVGHIDADLTADPPHPIDQDRLRYPLEIQAETSGQDGRGELSRLGSRQNEGDVFRRFLQRLEQRVEGFRRQHVDFIYYIYFVPALCRGIVDAVPQLADIIYAAVGSRVDLHDVQERPIFDRLTGGALTAGTLSLRKAVQSLGQQPCRRRLARPAGPAEQIGMARRPGSDLVF